MAVGHRTCAEPNFCLASHVVSSSVLEYARHGSQRLAALGASARWLGRSHERTGAPCAHAAVRAREQDPQVFGCDAVQADAAFAPRGRRCRCRQGLVRGTWFEVWGSKLRLQSGGHRFTLSSRCRRRAAALHGLREHSRYSAPLHSWHASDNVPGRLFEAARTACSRRTGFARRRCRQQFDLAFLLHKGVINVLKQPLVLQVRYWYRRSGAPGLPHAIQQQPRAPAAPLEAWSLKACGQPQALA